MNSNITHIRREDNCIQKYDTLVDYQASSRIAIVVHLFYTEVWEEISAYLSALHTEYDVWVSVPDSIDEKILLRLLADTPHASFFMLENKGRDVLPFLSLLPLLQKHKYAYICKIHSKKSIEINNGDAWRKLLYFDLLGSQEIVDNVIKTLDIQSDIGIITGKNLILSGRDFDLGNQAGLQNLSSLFNISFHSDYYFAAGTMFWVRMNLLTPLIPLIEKELLNFEEEAGQTDHTLAHVMERFFGLLCSHATLKIVESTADYTKLSKETLESLAVLAFTQRFKNDKDIQYRDKLIQERDAGIQKRDADIQERDQELIAIYQSKSYKSTFIFRKLPFVIQTLLHFNIKKIRMADSNEFRFVEAIKRRLPKKLLSLLKGIKRNLKKHAKKDKLWHQPLTEVSKYKGKKVLIVAELSIPQCTKYRVMQKVEMLEALGYESSVVSWTDFHEARNLLQTSAMVFFYRVPADTVVLDLIKEAKRLNIISIFDLDDLVFDRALLSQNLNIKNLDKKTQKMLLDGADLYQEALSLTDHSTASTITLGKMMQTHTQGENTLIPNCLDKELLNYQKVSETMVLASSNAETRLKIVYGSGTSTHDIDFLEVCDALLFILQKYKHVELIIHGTLTLPKVFDSVKAQITLIPFMPTQDYYKALQSYDINLAPLENSIFNDAKSNIKYLEASILGLPTVASDVAEYRSSISQGRTGFIAQDTATWIATLEQLIEDKALREDIAKNAYNAVIEDYSIETIAHTFMQPLLDTYIKIPASNTKHILMANVLYNPISFGGATIVIEELSQRINQNDTYHVTVFTGFFDENYDLPRPYDIVRYEVNHVPIILVRFPLPMSKTLEYRNEEMQKVFDDILLSLAPDLVHFHSIQQLSASITRPCVTHDIPYVITLHDMWWLCEKQFMIKSDNTYCYQTKIDTDYCITQCTHDAIATHERTNYLKPILKSATLVLAPSAFQAQMYRYNDIDAHKIKVNKNAIIFPASSYSKSSTQPLHFAYLGGNAIHKGYDFIKDIFESLPQSQYELTLIDLHKKLGHHSIVASDWNIKGKLTISDGYHYSQEGLDNFFSNIDILLFPSQWKESFGLTIREALVRDVWVISTNAGGVVEDIVEGKNGNIVSIGDSKAFEKCITSSIENSQKFTDYQNPHKQSIRGYDAQVEELLGYYHDILESP